MSETKRKYLAKIKRSRINMKEAVLELSPNAFKLLNLVYYGLLDAENLDNEMAMKYLDISRRPFFKAKDELKDLGYIKIHQVGSTKFVWVIGKEAISQDKELYKTKEKLDKEKYAKSILDYLFEVPYEDSKKYLKGLHKKSGVIVLEGFEQGNKGEVIENI